MSLAQRSVRSVGWNVFASPVQIGVQVVRAIILARLLSPEVFGLYAMASTIVRLSGLITGFGVAPAFLNRVPETDDEDRAASVHFTMKLMVTAVWLTAIFIYARAEVGQLFETYEGLGQTLIWLGLIVAATQLVITPRLILQRRVQFARLTIESTLGAVLATIASVTAALMFGDVRAMLAADLGMLVASLVVLYGWRPVWRPHFSLDRDVARYFLGFGSKNFPAVVLADLLDRVDDLWTGVYLGEAAMGFYNRAYRFASYPRSVLARPAENVSKSTYAELKHDRLRLSKAFFRVNAMLVRTGFGFAGLMVLIAPEFIRQVLGREWLPMLEAFRFLSIFALLEPLKMTVSGLFVSIGQPGRVLRARVLQFAVMVVGLYALGGPYGLAGVAAAVNIMLAVGLVSLFWQAREYVDFSLTRLFLAPTMALVVASIAGRAAILLPGVMGADWRTGGVKMVVFGALYVGILFAVEREQLTTAVRGLVAHLGLGRRVRGGDEVDEGDGEAGTGIEN